jgi:hypothetical protein
MRSERTLISMKERTAPNSEQEREGKYIYANEANARCLYRIFIIKQRFWGEVPCRSIRSDFACRFGVTLLGDPQAPTTPTLGLSPER